MGRSLMMGMDPTIFIDDDGTPIVCTTPGGPYCGILNDDLTSFKVRYLKSILPSAGLSC